MAAAGDEAVFDDDSFEIGRIDKEGKHIICVFNHTEKVKSIAVRLKSKTHLFDFWSDEDLGEHSGHFTLFDIPPHGARVLRAK